MKREGIPNTTPFPNVLLDECMYRLRDTEWRVLCVVVRQTIGWIIPGTNERKESDWLTHRQLRRRTGRSSAAISRALDVLSRLDFLVIRDSSGRRLTSAADRRRLKGKLFFGLQEHWLGPNKKWNS
jgi:hypothetical protein